MEDPRNDALSQIKIGISLKKAKPLPPKPVAVRDQTMMAIKAGAATLKHVEQNKFDANERMDDAVAKLLANRAAIAGDSDSDSDDDSDMDFDSDDDYP